MRNKAFYFLSLIAVSSLLAGCSSPEGPQQKLGRGMNNLVEFARMGELRRSMEQAAIFDSPGYGGITTGVIHGINRSFARTGAGLYEVLTFPIPNGLMATTAGVPSRRTPSIPTATSPIGSPRP